MPDIHPFGGRMSRHFARSPSRDPLAEPYLSYYDVRITKRDMDELKNDWLNDNVIAFWEEYLDREFLANFTNSKIVLLRPSMSYVLAATPDPTTLKEMLPDFTNVSHVFLTVNDAHRETDGSHWSLLLVSVVDGVSFHYDSLSTHNREYAYRLTGKFSTLLGRPLNFIELRDTPRQENTSDCGVYVCLFIRHLLLKRLLMVKSSEKVSMSLGNSRIDAREGRKEITRIIEDFRREAQKRRSMSNTPSSRKSKSPPRIDSPFKPDRP